MMRFRNDGSQSPPVVAHTISANGWVIAPATRLILSLLISPVGSRMPLNGKKAFLYTAYELLCQFNRIPLSAPLSNQAVSPAAARVSSVSQKSIMESPLILNPRTPSHL